MADFRHAIQHQERDVLNQQIGEGHSFYPIATGDEIENWCARKNSVEIRTDKRGPSRIVLTISNPGKLTVNNLVIQVEINAAAKRITLDTEIIGTKRARFDYDKKNKIVYVYINDMQPNESRTYYLDYSQPDS